MKKVFYGAVAGVGILVGVLIIILLLKPNFKDQVFGLATSDFTKYAGDVVGSRTGTSTVGVAFSVTGTGGISATTSYIDKIGGNKENAIYMLKPTLASSTALVQLELFGSSDDFCDATATSTTDAACVGDCILTSDINWYSAGDHLQNRTHLVNLLNDSSSSFLSWTNPSSTADGLEILLTNLNYECLKLDVAASSTVLYAGLRTK